MEIGIANATGRGNWKILGDTTDGAGMWFPLILAPSEKTRTVTLDAQQFLGQFVSDWNALLAFIWELIKGGRVDAFSQNLAATSETDYTFSLPWLSDPE